MKLSSTFLVCLLIVGCSIPRTPTAVDKYVPQPVKQSKTNSALGLELLENSSLAIASITTSIEEGKELGDSFGGLGCRFNQPGTYGISARNEGGFYGVYLGEDILIPKASATMKAHGLNVQANTAQDPFGTATSDMLITADITDLSVWTCFGGIPAPKPLGRLSMKVSWRVFEVETRKLLLEFHTSSAVEANEDRDVVMWLVLRALEDATKKFAQYL